MGHERTRSGDLAIGLGLTRYEPSLDGVRAFAVLAVVLYHANLLPGGWFGVDVFFVLSGFLITSLLHQELVTSNRIDIWRFYMRRALRLVPALALLLLVDVIFTTLTSRRPSDYQAALAAATYTMNWVRAFDLVPLGHLDHTWSLSMEEQFYLVWPAILILIFRRRPLLWVGALILAITAWRLSLALSGAEAERTYNGFDTHADALLIGCGLAFLPQRLRPARISTAHVAIPLAALLVCAIAFHRTSLSTQTVGLTIAALASAALVPAVLQGGWVRQALSSPALVYTGRISYGWYLWHYPILRIGKAYLPSVPGLGVALVLSAYGVAVLSYHYVEKPFLRLKARFEPTRARRDQQLQVADESPSPTVGRRSSPAAGE